MSSSPPPSASTDYNSSMLLLSIQRTLADTFIPPVLLERDMERECIISFLNNTTTAASSSDSGGGILYVCGSPGTGKSLTVRMAIDNYLSNKGRAGRAGAGAGGNYTTTSRVININAMTLNDPTYIFTILREEVGSVSSSSSAMRKHKSKPYTRPPIPHSTLGTTTRMTRNKRNSGIHKGQQPQQQELLEQCISDIIDVLDNSKNRTIIIIDEIDALITNTRGGGPCTTTTDDNLLLLRLLFHMTTYTKKLSIIAIANTVDIPRRISPYLASRNGNIKELVFKPYTHEQLKSILIQRLSSTISNNASSSSCIIDDHITWLDLASRKVAAIHGDCRKVLDVCRHTITGQISDKKMEVTAMDTIKVLNKCYRKDDDNIAKALEYLPFQQQVVLACCLTAMGHDNIEADIHVIKDHINRYMNIHKMPSVTWEVFHDHLQAIAGHGLISILYHHKSKGIQQQPPPPTRRRTTIRGTRGGSASCTSGGQQRVRLIAPFDTLLQGILSNHNKEYFADLLSPQLVLLPPPTNMQQ